MNTSILTSIKSMLGIEESYTIFDNDLIIYINSAISVLYQIGLESAESFTITGTDETWNDLLGGYSNIETVKPLLYLRVRKIFDPPQSQSVMSAMDAQISELEWRLNAEIDRG
jgi:hypothetical protein